MQCTYRAPTGVPCRQIATHEIAGCRPDDTPRFACPEHIGAMLHNASEIRVYPVNAPRQERELVSV